MMLAEILTDVGCEAEEAPNFREALRKFRAAGGRMHAAVLDLGLPDGCGHELVTEIRAAYPEFPIILASGFVDEGMRRQFADDGKLQFLTKPFNAEDLRAALPQLGAPLHRTA